MDSIVTVTSVASSFDLTTEAAVLEELGLDTPPGGGWTANAITRESYAAARHCNRTFARQTYSEQFRDVSNVASLSLKEWPLASITSITVDGTALTGSEYETDLTSGMLYRLSSDARMCWSAAKIVVIYIAGYTITSGVPPDLEKAVIDLVKLSYFDRSRDPALRSQEIPGVISETLWVGDTTNGSGMPPEISRQLEAFRRLDR